LKWLAGLLAIALTALMLLWRLPATWLDHGLQQASRGGLAMADAGGSVWRGEGSLQAILPEGEAVTLAQVAWRLDASALVRGALRYVVTRRGDGQLMFDAEIGPLGWRLHALDAQFPASLLGAFSGTLARLKVSGAMQVRMLEVSREAGLWRGSGTIDWRDAASGVSRLRPLGDYHIDVVGKGERLEYRLGSRGGKLELRGSGAWRPGDAPDFRGEAVPAPEYRADLAPLLRMIGKDNGSGTYALVLDASTGLGVR